MTDHAINIDARIDANPISALQWRVVGICFLLAVVDGFDAQAIAFVAPLLKTQFAISAEAMGGLFSAALLGLMAGAFGFSPLADKIGRKPVIMIACALMGGFALATAYASNVSELYIYRFLTGLGLGGVMPNINTLTAEYAPKRSRALLMTAMFTGFPLGAVLGGLVSAQLIAAFGWPSVFLMGGIAPLTLLLVIAAGLPESVRYLSTRRGREGAVGQILRKIDGTYVFDATHRFTAQQTVQNDRGLRALFGNGRAMATLLIWLIYFANLLMMYTLMNWLPSVMREAGLPLHRAIATTVLFNLGGVLGGLAIAWWIDRRGPIGVLLTAFCLAACAIAATGQAGSLLPLIFTCVFLAGIGVIGTQLGMNAVVASFYPTSIRATGLGWALAVGRIGSVVGPILVGVIIGLEWSRPALFIATAIPASVCVAALLILRKCLP